MTSSQERREDARTDVDKPVKVRCLRSGRYYPGRVCNLSAGGALVELAQPHRFAPGERLKLGIAWNRRQTVLDSHTLIDSVVTRSLGLGDRHRVAVRFEHRQELAATA